MSDEEELELDNGEDESLHAAVTAAFEKAEKEPSSSPEKAPKVADASASPEPASSDARPRAADGKFVPKGASESTPDAQRKPTPQAPAPSETAPVAATRKPPASWSPDLHSQWNAVPPAIQEAILKREHDAASGIDEKSQRLKAAEERSRSYEELDRTIAPWAQKLAAQGGPAKGIANLLKAQDYLERDPVNALLWLQQSLRVDPSRLVAALSQNPAQRQQMLVAQATQQQATTLETLQRKIAEMEFAPVKSEIETFRADPAHPHFDVLRPLMHQFVVSGQAEDLATAYDLAMYANPETRKAAIAEQAEAQAKALRDQEAEKAKAAKAQRQTQAQEVSRARSAAVSIRGAPNGGALARIPSKTVYADVEAAYDAHS